jgi:Holliday junction resolvase-like predicted endonuclease
MHDATGLQDLIAEYGRLKAMDGHTPQSRGQRFNEVVATMLRCWGLEAQESVRAVGEIDVAFSLGNQRYVLEAKWEKARADTGHVAKLQRRVAQRLQGTVGIFLAMAGYTADALDEVNRGARLEVLLLDRVHFEAMLSGLVPPSELLGLLHDRASFRGESYTPLLTLLKSDATRAAPKVIFDTLECGSDVPFGEQQDASIEALFTLSNSNQIGIAVRKDGHLLATSHLGIIDVDLAKRRCAWAVPIADCHRSPLIQSDGAILFARRYGIGRFFEGELEIVAGGFSSTTCLIGKNDDSYWVLDNGDLVGTPGPSITRLGSRLGDEARHSLPYPTSSASNAIWLNDDTLVTIGNPGFLVMNLASGASRMIRTARSNPMGLARIGSNVILILSDSVLGVADIATERYADIMTLDLRPSVNEIAADITSTFYVASYFGNNATDIKVLRVDFSSNVESVALSVLSDANRDNFSVFQDDIQRLKDTISESNAEETESQRLSRLYNEAHQKVRSGILRPLERAIGSSGLQMGIADGVALDGSVPNGYGGGTVLPT